MVTKNRTAINYQIIRQTIEDILTEKLEHLPTKKEFNQKMVLKTFIPKVNIHLYPKYPHTLVAFLLVARDNCFTHAKFACDISR
ncbi:MAG: hypothetical protein UV04_C0033G0012 [Candidatus Gottesmanbacteria bacterium GW2011_GWA2_42_16]|nr:MAG: hypothetical protein UV04_C0033G0012 [Candidatus Gottesmanbacteria bacterium GW2011_GWA2_42_16]